jgi:hypothetical protein
MSVDHVTGEREEFGRRLAAVDHSAEKLPREVQVGLEKSFLFSSLNMRGGF